MDLDQAIFEKVQKIRVEQLGVSYEDVTADASFVVDLGQTPWMWSS